MKYVLVLVVLVGLVGWDKKDHLILKTYQNEAEEVVVSSDKVDYSFKKVNGDLSMKYCKESGCTVYLIRNKGGKYVSEKGDTSGLILVQEFSYKINRTDYRVEKFLLDRKGFDSKSYHYFSSEFGIMLIKSKTWEDFAVLSKPGDENLNTLIMVLLRDQLSTDIADQRSQMPADTLLDKEIEAELK